MSHSPLQTKIDLSYGPSSRIYIRYTRSLALHLSHVHIEASPDAARTDIPLDNLASTLNPTKHLCEQISNLFPQLHYLRLHMDHLCPVLLNFVGGWPTWPISASAAQEQDRPTWDIRSVICWVVELPRQHARGPGYPKVLN